MSGRDTIYKRDLERERKPAFRYKWFHLAEPWTSQLQPPSCCLLQEEDEKRTGDGETGEEEESTNTHPQRKHNTLRYTDPFTVNPTPGPVFSRV